MQIEESKDTDVYWMLSALIGTGSNALSEKSRKWKGFVCFEENRTTYRKDVNVETYAQVMTSQF